jgi:hypothetical protein
MTAGVSPWNLVMEGIEQCMRAQPSIWLCTSTRALPPPVIRSDGDALVSESGLLHRFSLPLWGHWEAMRSSSFDLSRFS